MDLTVKTRNIYTVECRGADGQIKWTERLKNITVNEGLNEILQQFWKGSTYTAAFYVALKGSGTILAADTAASHGGWTEEQTYSQSTRPALTLGTVASQSVDNSGSVATFSMNGAYTAAGAFIITNNTKGGTSGKLIGGANFTTTRTGGSGDTITVTVTATAATA